MSSLQSFSKSGNWISKYNDMQVVLHSNEFYLKAPWSRDTPSQSISVQKWFNGVPCNYIFTDYTNFCLTCIKYKIEYNEYILCTVLLKGIITLYTNDLPYTWKKAFCLFCGVNYISWGIRPCPSTLKMIINTI